MSERYGRHTLPEAQRNAHAVRRMRPIGNGVAVGVARDRKSLLQIVWASRHLGDERLRTFAQSADAHGPTIQTVIREVDGSTQTIDTMLTRPIRGIFVKGQQHIVGTDDIRRPAFWMSHPRTPHDIHQLGPDNEPEGEAPDQFRRILGRANVGIDARRTGAGHHIASFQLFARSIQNPEDPMKPLDVRPVVGSFREHMRPGVALAVFGAFDNDEQAYARQPLALPLGANVRMKEIDQVGRYFMELTGAMAVAVKRITPTVAEPELFHINASK